VARLVAVKRLDRFLQGLAIAREKNPRIRGVIVGDGPEKQNYQALAEHLGLTPDGVSFAGLQLDVPNWLNRADIFCLTSDQEGFPNVILEAMAAGLPVITTPAGDADTVVQEGITGTIIAMDDGQDLAGRLVQLASDPDLRTRMGAAGRHRVETVYSYESLASRLIQAYQKMALLRKNQPVLRALHPFKEIGMAPDHY
ncbi:MAG TPA: glycosyltransferase family 4 protein, partial [Anaerolineaceae bacterium]|nr:glycosyltransferase family 4 protein [Anaerolineaceae bacterium]